MLAKQASKKLIQFSNAFAKTGGPRASRSFHSSRTFRQEQQSQEEPSKDSQETKKEETPSDKKKKFKFNNLFFAFAGGDILLFAYDVYQRTNADGIASIVATAVDPETEESQRVAAFDFLARSCSYIYSRDVFVKESAIDALLKGVSDSNRAVRISSMEGLANLAKSRVLGEAILTVPSVLQAVSKTIQQQSDSEETECAFKLLSALSINSKNHQALLSSVKPEAIVNALNSQSKTVSKSAQEIVAFLSANPSNQATLVSCGAQDALTQLSQKSSNMLTTAVPIPFSSTTNVHVTTALNLLTNPPATPSDGLEKLDTDVQEMTKLKYRIESGLMAACGFGWSMGRWYLKEKGGQEVGKALVKKLVWKGLGGAFFVGGTYYAISFAKRRVRENNERDSPSSSDTTACTWEPVLWSASMLIGAQLVKYIGVPFAVMLPMTDERVQENAKKFMK